MKKFLFLLISLTYMSLTINSQIVNIEKKRKASNGFQSTIGLDFNIKESANRIIEIKNNIDLQYSLDAHSFIFLNNISFLKVDNGSLVNNGFQHIRYNYTIKDSSFVTLEVFGQYQYNELKLLQKRILGGLGPRFRMINNNTIKWYFAPLLMYEHEQINDSLSSQSQLIRLDAYTNINVSISKFASFNFISYYQPNLKDFSDYRLSGESVLRFKFNKYLSYDIGYAIDYDNAPPGDIQYTFWYFKNSLIIKL